MGNSPSLTRVVSAQIRRVLQQEWAASRCTTPAVAAWFAKQWTFRWKRLCRGAARYCDRCYLGGRAAGAHAKNCVEIGNAKPGGRIGSEFLAEGLQSLCYVPLLRPNGPLGLFVLGSTRKEAFRSSDLKLLEQVAAQLSIAIENHRAAAEIAALKERLSEERKYLEGEVQLKSQFEEIIGESAALRQVLDQVTIVSSSGATVLILGETGTGKELIARAIHRLSNRKREPFIKLNCAAIPTGLLESELFGHEKGAFTGAVTQKIGRLELAHGGTLFLDEVGEIPQELQPKLLRVLQDREFERLGSNHTIHVDVRLVAATNRELAREVTENRFRRDLYYRLSVFPIHIPPLRERKEDIPVLIRHFVHKFALRMNRKLRSYRVKRSRNCRNGPGPGMFANLRI